MKKLSLNEFEYAVYNRNYEVAARMLVNFLSLIDKNYGAMPDQIARNSALPNGHYCSIDHFTSRLTAAISALFSDREFRISPDWQVKLLNYHRSVNYIFTASPVLNADHVLNAIANPEDALPGNSSEQQILSNLFKFCFMYTSESSKPIDMDAIFARSPKLAINLAFVLASSRFLESHSAHRKREFLLGWLPKKLEEYGTLANLPTGILQDLFMGCSYADRPDKHEIKRSINKVLRKDLLTAGFADLNQTIEPHIKPKIFVMLECYNESHAFFRFHSDGLRALKKRFHVIGFGYQDVVDNYGQKIFHEFVTLDRNIELGNQIQAMLDHAKSYTPSAIFYPSIGMFPLSIHLSNLRMAPIQLTAIGHGASSMATCIDYYAVDNDFVGDPETFSEEVIALPTDAVPFVKSSNLPKTMPTIQRSDDGIVRIVVDATKMKYNPRFIETCRLIVHRSSIHIEMHFIFSSITGLIALHLKKVILDAVPNAIVFDHMPHDKYVAHLVSCDLFINPFPYGNMNETVDMLEIGLPGVCLSGPQIHERIDAGIFQRVDMPDWTIAANIAEYVAAALRLIENKKERDQITNNLKSNKMMDVLYEGRADILSEILYKKVLEK